MGSSFTGFSIKTPVFFARRGVVLNNKIIPIGDPHGAIRPHFGMHRSNPLILAGK
jgi:hypothetical protein